MSPLSTDIARPALADPAPLPAAGAREMLFSASPQTEVGTWVDSFTQWLVTAPIAAQMLFMLLFIVPIAVAAAWIIMAVVDRIGLALERRIQPSRARGTKMDEHVTTQS